MSEQAAAFIARIKSDKAFRDKVLTVEDPGARLELIAAEGYEVTAADIAAAAGALDDADLLAVAGGALHPDLSPYCTTDTCAYR
jgi:predicted ribosomally synthesized peptide with nif11-like leader